MENWILYGLIGGLFMGTANFYSKFIAAKNLNKNRIFFYSKFCTILYPLIYLGFQLDFAKISTILGLLIIVRSVAALEKSLFIVETLKYIDTGLFFPIHKIIHVFLTFIIGMVIFGEYLNITQIFAVLSGITAIFLLANKENKKLQIDYKKGIGLLIVTNILVLFSSTINKYITYVGFDIPTYLFLSGLIGAIYLGFTKKDLFEKVDKDIRNKELKVGFIRGTLTFFGFFGFMYALLGGPFVLVQVLHLTSIFIPILLSIIIFDEQVNKKKILAFGFFILMIFLINV